MVQRSTILSSDAERTPSAIRRGRSLGKSWWAGLESSPDCSPGFVARPRRWPSGRPDPRSQQKTGEKSGLGGRRGAGGARWRRRLGSRVGRRRRRVARRWETGGDSGRDRQCGERGRVRARREPLARDRRPVPDDGPAAIRGRRADLQRRRRLPGHLDRAARIARGAAPGDHRQAVRQDEDGNRQGAGRPESCLQAPVVTKPPKAPWVDEPTPGPRPQNYGQAFVKHCPPDFAQKKPVALVQGPPNEAQVLSAQPEAARAGLPARGARAVPYGVGPGAKEVRTDDTATATATSRIKRTA